MFDRFSRRAMNVMSLAKEEARGLKVEYIGTEHLLLGLLGGSGIAARVLRHLGLDIDTIRTRVRGLVNRVTWEAQQDPLSFSSSAKRVLSFAEEEARQLGHDYIGTEHLLLGLLRVEEGIAAPLLKDLEFDFAGARQTALEWMAYSDEVAAESSRQLETTPPAPALSPTIPSSPNTPTLDCFGIDLTEKSRSGALDPTVGRSSDIDRVLSVMNRRRHGNPLLVGDPGVGKRSLVHALVEWIEGQAAPTQFHSHRLVLPDHRLVKLDLPRILAGTRYRGQLEERFLALFFETRRARNVILVIEDPAHWIGVGRMAQNPGLDAAFLLRSALADSPFRVLATTTPQGLRKLEAQDPALASLFQPLHVEPTNRDETLAILESHRPRLDAHHRVRIDDAAILEAHATAVAHFPHRALPGSAVDLLDFAAATVARPKLGAVEMGSGSTEGEITGANPTALPCVQASDVREAARRMAPTLTKANRAEG